MYECPVRLPATMAALELSDYGPSPGSLQSVERPVPKPGPGQVLVRIQAAPIHPADHSFIHGVYGALKPLPIIPGWEGAGLVVAVGPGLAGRSLQGRRVACFAETGNGTWADYAVVDAKRCLPLHRSLTDEQGAMLFVNPLSAWAMLERARRGGHRALVVTAGASTLGRLLLGFAPRFGLQVIPVVRRNAQCSELVALGAATVLDSSQADFPERLADVCRRYGVTLAYDAVSGRMTETLLASLPVGGQVTIFGRLSDDDSIPGLGQLIFGDKRLDGFWLTSWLASLSWLRLLTVGWTLQRLLLTLPPMLVHSRRPLSDGYQAVQAQDENLGTGKILFLPGQDAQLPSRTVRPVFTLPGESETGY